MVSVLDDVNDSELRNQLAELLAAKSVEEIERVRRAIRARGVSSLRRTATALAACRGTLSLRLQSAAVEIALEVGGAEGTELLLALAVEGNVDEDHRVAAVRALGLDAARQSVRVLLPTLANEGPHGTELGKAIVEYLARLPADFDWIEPVRDADGSCLNPLWGAVRDARLPSLDALCSALDAARRTRRGPRVPLARPEAIASLHNSYLDEFESWQARPHSDDTFWEDRDAVSGMREVYSYAIPTRAALEIVAAHAPILEIGAGTGYWAWLLRRMGVDVIAHDEEPPDGTYRNRWFEGALAWTEVLEGGPEKITEHPRRNLFLCWPPPGHPMAMRCLELFVGDFVLFAGDWRGGCASAAFFDELERKFEEVAVSRLPSWFVDDALRVWRRR